MDGFKPCPFCNDEDIEKTDNMKYGSVACGGCGAVTFVCDWDTRPIEDALRSSITELEKERRFVPVEERLPEAESTEVWETYLCLLDRYGEELVAPMWFIGGSWYTDYQANSYSRYDKFVIGWEILPDPSSIKVDQSFCKWDCVNNIQGQKIYSVGCNWRRVIAKSDPEENDVKYCQFCGKQIKFV